MKNLEFKELSAQELEEVNGGNPVVIAIGALVAFVGTIIFGHMKDL